MSGGRAGEQDEAVVGARPRRRWLVAVVIVLALVVPIIGSGLTNDFWSEYPRNGACKGYGYGGSLLDEAGRPGHRTPEEALAAFAVDALALSRMPVPADGWVQYRGRWVRDLGDGTFYEVDVNEYSNGWVVEGDVMICGR